MIDEHEDRARLKPLWKKCRDCLSEEVVKAAGDLYLPRVGFHVRTDANKRRDPGDADFIHFKTMSRFPEAFDATIHLYAGKIETKPDTWSTGHEATQRFIANANGAGAGIEDLIRQHVIDEVLTVGAIGALVDNLEGESVRAPVIRFYNVESIINFEIVKGRCDWVVLEENTVTKKARVDQKLKVDSQSEKRYRFMRVEDGELVISLHKDDGSVIWTKNQQVNDVPLASVPFSIWSVDGDGFATPPLLKLANACLDYYRVRAMHRRGLAFGTSPVLWASGVSDSESFSPVPGQMAISTIEDDSGAVAFAEYEGKVIPEVRQDLAAIQDQIIQLGATNLQSERPSSVSRQSLQIMDSSDSCVLSKYVRRVSTGVRGTLRYIAVNWLGASETDADGISYQINTDFWVDEPDPGYLQALVALSQNSYLRLEDVFFLLKRKDMLAPGVDYDSWRRDVLRDMERNQDIQALRGRFGATTGDGE